MDNNAENQALYDLLAEIVAVLMYQPSVPHNQKIDILKALDAFRAKARIPDRGNDPEA